MRPTRTAEAALRKVSITKTVTAQVARHQQDQKLGQKASTLDIPSETIGNST